MSTILDSALHPRVGAWLEVREPLEHQLAPLGQAAMRSLEPLAGARALDIGCGIGSTPHALARAVGPRGHVVALDILPSAMAVARHDPDRPANLTFVCGDAEAHPFGAATFDALYSRFGVMFFSDRIRAFQNLQLALRPGGRIAFVCWRGLDENELDAFPLAAGAEVLPAGLISRTEAAAWFSFSDPEVIRATLVAAGFEQVDIRPHDETVGTGDARSMVEVCARVGALGAILRDHPAFVGPARSALEAALQPRDGPGGPRLRAATWLVAAQKPVVIAPYPRLPRPPD